MALEIMKENDIAVIVTDMRMPGISGLELLKIAKEKYPYTIRIVLYGYVQLPQVLATINHVDVFKFILKPWDMESGFLNIIREAFDYHGFLIQREAIRISHEKRYNLYLNILKSTDEKFDKYERELSSIKLISQQILDYMKSYIVNYSNKAEKNNDSMLKINLLNQIYKDYLKSIPLKNSYFKIKNLIDGFNSVDFGNDNKSKILFSINDNVNVKVNGNLELILAIMSTIIKLALYCNDVDDSLITFKSEKGFYYRNKKFS